MERRVFSPTGHGKLCRTEFSANCLHRERSSIRFHHPVMNEVGDLTASVYVRRRPKLRGGACEKLG